MYVCFSDSAQKSGQPDLSIFFTFGACLVKSSTGIRPGTGTSDHVYSRESRLFLVDQLLLDLFHHLMYSRWEKVKDVTSEEEVEAAYHAASLSMARLNRNTRHITDDHKCRL